MPSANPDLSSDLKLPSPLPADPPDIPGDLKALADAIDTAVQFGQVTATVSNANQSGDVTVTYSHPYAAPPAVLVQTQGTGIWVAFLPVNPGSSTFKLRIRHVDKQNVSASIPVSWVAIGRAS